MPRPRASKREGKKDGEKKGLREFNTIVELIEAFAKFKPGLYREYQSFVNKNGGAEIWLVDRFLNKVEMIARIGKVDDRKIFLVNTDHPDREVLAKIVGLSDPTCLYDTHFNAISKSTFF